MLPSFTDIYKWVPTLSNVSTETSKFLDEIFVTSLFTSTNLK